MKLGVFSISLTVKDLEASKAFRYVSRVMKQFHKMVKTDSRVWMGVDVDRPRSAFDHWNAAQALAEGWRGSAHRLLEQLDRSGEATIERRQQERMLTVIRAKGTQGIELRDLYRQMHITTKAGRQVAQELVKAGLVIEARINGAEAYIAIEHLSAQ